MNRRVRITFDINVNNADFRNEYAENGIYEMELFHTILREVEKFPYADLEALNGRKIKTMVGNTVGEIKVQIS